MTALTVFLKVSILIAAAALIQQLLGRRVSAATRHLIWTLAIAGALLLPMLSLILPEWAAYRNSGNVPIVAEGVIEKTNPSAQFFSAALGSIDGSAQSSTTIPWAYGGAILYVAVVLFLLIRLVVDCVRAKKVLRHASEVDDLHWQDLLVECARSIGFPQKVTLLRSPEEAVPMAFGIRRFAIVIPAAADAWALDQRRAVLLHELAHLARQDCLIQMIASVACAFYWVHPGVWWIARRLRIDRELACDDRVLLAGADAHDYASQLLELAYAGRRVRPPLAAVSMAGSAQLEARMRALLDAANNRKVPAPGVYLAGLIIFAGLLIPLAGATVSTPQNADLEKQGSAKLSIEKLLELRRQGIDAKYVRDLAAQGFTKLSLDTLLELRRQGIDAEYIQGLAAQGYPGLSLDTLLELRKQGIDPEYIKEMQRLEEEVGTGVETSGGTGVGAGVPAR